LKLLIVPAFACGLAFLPSPASAIVTTFGPSTQSVTFTGIGNNALGEGQSQVDWGNCVVSGSGSAAVTNCTVSAPFSDINEGGVLNLVWSYPGSGALPLKATSTSPGGNLIVFSATANATLTATYVRNDGPTYTIYQATNWSFVFANPTCSTNLPVCGVAQEGAMPNSTISGSITGMFDATPVIRTSLGVISASAFGGFSAVAPGSWMEIYGTNLATVLSQTWVSFDFAGHNAPISLGMTTVRIGGQSAFIEYVSPGQVNAQVPLGVAPGLQPVIVFTAGGYSTPFMITVNAAAEPGLLAPSVFNAAAGQYVAALFPDGVTYVLPPGVTNAVPTARAKPGDIITFYGVGFGLVTPGNSVGQIVIEPNMLQSAFQAFFAGAPATVAYAGLVVGYVGLYQFNIVVPNVAASDTVPFTFSLGGTSGPQNILISVGN